MSQLDHNLLEAALLGLEAQARRIDQQIAEVRARLGGRGRTQAPAAAAPAEGGRRELSPEARKRIAEAQRKRWAAYHAKQEEKPQPQARRASKKAAAAKGKKAAPKKAAAKRKRAKRAAKEAEQPQAAAE